MAGTWLKNHGWNIATFAAMALIGAGQYLERVDNMQRAQAAQQQTLPSRPTVEHAIPYAATVDLDRIYLRRELAEQTNNEILRRLASIDEELKALRRSR